MERINFKIKNQIEKCYSKYGKYASAHEFLGVLIEEIEELKAEIFKKHLDFDLLEAEIIDCITVLFKGYNDIVKEKNER